jgi:hypothetical protein
MAVRTRRIKFHFRLIENTFLPCNRLAHTTGDEVDPPIVSGYVGTPLRREARPLIPDTIVPDRVVKEAQVMAGNFKQIGLEDISLASDRAAHPARVSIDKQVRRIHDDCTPMMILSVRRKPGRWAAWSTSSSRCATSGGRPERGPDSRAL